MTALEEVDALPIDRRPSLRPSAAAVLMDVSRSTVYELVRTGQLRRVAGLRVIRIARVEIDRFLEGRDQP